jgi:protein-disulfide isomerase
MSDRIGNAALAILMICAVATTGLTLHRELRNPDDTDKPRTILDWQQYSSGGHNIGANATGVSVIIFSDYECPFCKSLNARVDELQRIRPDAQIVIRHFPLDGHPNARPAARAAICASEQGRFRSYHDSLFAHAGSGKSWDYVALAKSNGLEIRNFESCLRSTRPDSVLQEDINKGKLLNVVGTPAILVADKLYVGLPGNLPSILRKAPHSRRVVSLSR